MRTVAEEVERCLPYFVRLCVNSVIVSGAPLDEASRHVALDLSDKMRRQPGMSADQQDHFYSALEQLIQLVSALSPRLPPDLLRDFAEKATQAQVASTLERSLMGALKAEAI
ncbi:hypothetical protein E8L99_21510 [Phreatobacter aquaticus]|uniref:Uncharacterized protein n=1 Tax=Phreatobacter aquaticus TaxID=2570229 RepID=A0A4D7QW13_9HYPH|nr:hypothetical protein [Phreatobacter aquaticus]QCK88152.1 hypothetical protein E8L99_21510 [Phreatobacter aquaticus]